MNLERLSRFMEQPVASFLTIGVFSLVSAYLFSTVGGSVARVVSGSPTMGATIELGGAIAGFAAVLLISVRLLERLRALPSTRRRQITVILIPRDAFTRSDSYRCTVSIYDKESGEDREVPAVPRFENGHLTIDLRDLRDSELFRVAVRDATGHQWQSEFCHVSAPRAEMHAI